MTLRVGKVGPDGTVEFGRQRVVKVKPDPTVLREGACRYPPCACPRHRPDLHEGASAVLVLQGRRGASAVRRRMAELWTEWR